jgi:hypothetical protein
MTGRIVYEIDDDAKTLFIPRIWHGARGDLELPEETPKLNADPAINPGSEST